MKKWRSVLFALMLALVAIPAVAGTANAAAKGHHPHHARRGHHHHRE